MNLGGRTRPAHRRERRASAHGRRRARSPRARRDAWSLTGRRADALEALAAEIGGRAVAADLPSPTAPERAARGGRRRRRARRQRGAAGQRRADARFSLEEIDRALAVNLRAPIVLARLLAEPMAARGAGHLVFVSSLSGKAARAGSRRSTRRRSSACAASRSALRQDLAAHGVGVSCVFPGFVRDAGMFADSGRRAAAAASARARRRRSRAAVVRGDRAQPRRGRRRAARAAGRRASPARRRARRGRPASALGSTDRALDRRRAARQALALRGGSPASAPAIGVALRWLRCPTGRCVPTVARRPAAADRPDALGSALDAAFTRIVRGRAPRGARAARLLGAPGAPPAALGAVQRREAREMAARWRVRVCRSERERYGRRRARRGVAVTRSSGACRRAARPPRPPGGSASTRLRGRGRPADSPLLVAFAVVAARGDGGRRRRALGAR